MKFRPCIDIHNGQVKQIVGGSLSDDKNFAKENFVSPHDAGWYAALYKKHQLAGGHIILLNPAGSDYYAADAALARQALAVYNGGMQIGGGMNADNAGAFLEAGASHIIVTSYVFKNGRIHFDRLQELKNAVGKKHLVLDLSCKKLTQENSPYYIVTDRWQKFTSETICEETFARLAPYCDEFLIHAVDVEGKSAGIESRLIADIARMTDLPVTYAGGIHTLEDIENIRQLGNNRIDFTVGSALDLFGGHLPFTKLAAL